MNTQHSFKAELWLAQVKYLQGHWQEAVKRFGTITSNCKDFYDNSSSYICLERFVESATLHAKCLCRLGSFQEAYKLLVSFDFIEIPENMLLMEMTHLQTVKAVINLFSKRL